MLTDCEAQDLVDDNQQALANVAREGQHQKEGQHHGGWEQEVDQELPSCVRRQPSSDQLLQKRVGTCCKCNEACLTCECGGHVARQVTGLIAQMQTLPASSASLSLEQDWKELFARNKVGKCKEFQLNRSTRHERKFRSSGEATRGAAG